jgi:hypothetical protein
MSYWHALNWNGLVSPGSIIAERSPAPEPVTSNSGLSDWSSLYNLSRIQTSNSLPGYRSPQLATRLPSVPKPKFDGRDRLRLEEGWVLIKGENALFLEAVCNGLDPSGELFSNGPERSH